MSTGIEILVYTLGSPFDPLSVGLFINVEAPRNLSKAVEKLDRGFALLRIATGNVYFKSCGFYPLIKRITVRAFGETSISSCPWLYVIHVSSFPLIGYAVNIREPTNFVSELGFIFVLKRRFPKICGASISRSTQRQFSNGSLLTPGWGVAGGIREHRRMDSLSRRELSASSGDRAHLPSSLFSEFVTAFYSFGRFDGFWS